LCTQVIKVDYIVLKTTLFETVLAMNEKEIKFI